MWKQPILISKHLYQADATMLDNKAAGCADVPEENVDACTICIKSYAPLVFGNNLNNQSAEV